MIPPADLAFDDVLRRSRDACAALSEADDGLKREILGYAGDRWSLGIVYALAGDGTLRHSEIGRRLGGVSQRMLTRALRQLERDGLIVRHDHGEVPPRVDYALTALGRGLLAGMLPVWDWALAHADAIRAARLAYDRASA